MPSGCRCPPPASASKQSRGMCCQIASHRASWPPPCRTHVMPHQTEHVTMFSCRVSMQMGSAASEPRVWFVFPSQDQAEDHLALFGSSSDGRRKLAGLSRASPDRTTWNILVWRTKRFIVSDHFSVNRSTTKPRTFGILLKLVGV